MNLSTNNKYKEPAVRRIFDVLFSTAVLLLGAIPVFLPIAAVIAVTGNRPVIFKQKRNGLNGKVFLCYKFHTLKAKKNQTGNNENKIANQDTFDFIPLGKFLRSTGLDELPQFFNVLKGDMSVVGPRPMMVEENEFFMSKIPGYEKRFEVKPGITGLAQIEGYKGKITSLQFMKDRLDKDMEYINGHSFKGDLIIIGKTFLGVFGFRKKNK